MGYLHAWMADCYHVFSSDINPWALSQAKHNVPEGQFALLSTDELIVFPGAAFDIVIAKHAVAHLHHPEQAIGVIAGC
jgi:2-polyprenyl-3-methyl-5-hydroxy-6-metoxy-1,4-benzoquinol methylase